MREIGDLYNRVRPRTFKDMYNTSDFLRNIDARVGRALRGEPGMSHVFMFHSEMPGLGKTSCGRILASELNPSNLTAEERDRLFNGLPNPVAIHINAGANGKVADIRLLIEQIENLRYPIYDYKYVFIIDEVHKLTEEAIDALLAPLENIPDNVYVTMTTTDIRKLSQPKSPGAALLSRCELHQFRPLSKVDMERLLNEIADKVSLGTLEEKVLETIYRESSGRPRDAIVMLSQYMETGLVGILPEDKRDIPFFKELVDMFVDVVETGAKGAWAGRIGPHIEKMLREHNAEDARIKLMHRLYEVILHTKLGGSKAWEVAALYEYMGRELRGFLSVPYQTELVTRLYSIYLKAVQLGATQRKEK